MDRYVGRSATDQSLWWISEHHDRQLQLQGSLATKAEASALQWLVALLPLAALRSKAAIPWASSTQATLQSFRGLMPSSSGDVGFQRVQALRDQVIACA